MAAQDRRCRAPGWPLARLPPSFLLRVFACFLLSTTGVAGNPHPSRAQQHRTTPASRSPAGEFESLVATAFQAEDPEQLITAATRALRLEPQIGTWPLPEPRDKTRGLLWRKLGDGFKNREGGSREDNLERAIAAYTKALTLLTRQISPYDWAGTHNNLGNAYSDRVGGDRDDNLDHAIASYDSALQVYTRSAHPRQWAAVQINLADAYSNRERGARAENRERAIASYEAALTVLTRDEASTAWAHAKHNLGDAYAERIRGDRADNLERAIAALEDALTVFTAQNVPDEWAGTLHDLGDAYRERVKGDRAENVERAIAALDSALTVYTAKGAPVAWADVKHLLGAAYRARIQGDRAENIERAIAAYEDVLTVRTPEGSPRSWADTQINLGNAYTSRMRGQRGENIEHAILAYRNALTVIGRSKDPMRWAHVQNSLAAAFGNRRLGDPEENRERAISGFEAVLSVYTKDAFPNDWATTQANLGAAYAYRIRGDRSENLARAIGSYEDALTVHTPEQYPRDHMMTAAQLGAAALETHQWAKAATALSSAREDFLLLFGAGLDEAAALDLLRLADSLFSDAAYVAVELGDPAAALALANEGRARLLSVSLKLQTLDLPADRRLRLDQLRQAIRDEERRIETIDDEGRRGALDRVIALRRELLDLVRAGESAQGVGRAAIAIDRSLFADNGAVVVPIVTAVGGKLLIVANGGAEPPAISVLDLPELTTVQIDRLLRGDPRSDKIGGWLEAYNINYATPYVQAMRWPEWLAAIEEIGPELSRLFAGKLQQALVQRGLTPGARLIWLPTGALGILPLGLAEDPVSKRRLSDQYEIVYAPGLGPLKLARAEIERGAAPSLAAVVNPTGDLVAAEEEGEMVAGHFPSGSRTVVAGSAATIDRVLAALSGRSYWHFASHGQFSWDDSRQSALLMAEAKPLTVGRLMETQALGRPRLVVLSACETGLYGIDDSPDEFVGLPGAFMALGAAGVLATLWPVSDDATALLMAKFYDLHLDEKLAPPTALQRAQAWLRQATSDQVVSYASVSVARGRLARTHLAGIEQAMSNDALARGRYSRLVRWDTDQSPPPSSNPATVTGKSVARPYAHPFFWAGFIYTGL
jgi:CHAT domain-containing protein/tetratricopeptide (TPR) repeat protein